MISSIDFYHLMEYLKPVGINYIDKKNPATDFNKQEINLRIQGWVEQSKVKIKAGQIKEVIEELKPYVEPS